MSEHKFPTEVIDIPSGGKVYSKDSPLADGKIEIKYMTAKEEDILMSENLIKKGVVIDKLLDSLIVTKGVKQQHLLLGDKNAVLVACRILAYGPDYTCEVVNPSTNEKSTHTFNLADCPFKKLPKGVTENKFNLKLPASKAEIQFKLLTGKEELIIEKELKGSKKIGTQILPELTTRLRHLIISVNGDDSAAVINNFTQNLLARDSLELRKELQRVQPDIELKQEIDMGGDVVEVDIPLTTEFFWPQS